MTLVEPTYVSAIPFEHRHESAGCMDTDDAKPLNAYSLRI